MADQATILEIDEWIIRATMLGAHAIGPSGSMRIEAGDRPGPKVVTIDGRAPSTVVAAALKAVFDAHESWREGYRRQQAAEEARRG